MIRWIVGSSLKCRGLVVAVAAALMFFGIAKLRDMPVDVLPEFGPPTVEIQTEALGLSAAEVEQLITVPMEQDLLNGVAWLDVIRSESVPGLSSIDLIFEPGTDLFRARQVVAERLTQAHALPNVSRPPQMLQPRSSENRVLMIGLSSKDLSLIDMSVLARWTIKPRLLGVPGVANVALFGSRERQLQVLVDPQRLQAHGVALNQVIETTANALWVSPLTFVEASTPGTGGFIDTPNQRLGVQHLSPITTPADLAEVPIEGTAQGSNARLGDVANVIEDHQPLIGDAVFANGPGLLLVVEKFPEANTLEVTRGVEDAIAALKPGLRGVDFDTTIFRPASYIETSIDNITTALIIGGSLMAVMLGAFLFEWRTALISTLAIALSLTTGSLVLYARGATVNAMVLAGLVLAVGVVVDDAIVDTENIRRRQRQHRKAGRDKPTAAIVLEASLEVRRVMIYATLVVGLAALPLFFLRGESDAFFPPLLLTYLGAVGACLLVALTVTPALSLLLLANAPASRPRTPVLRWLHRGYDRLLARVLAKPLRTFLAGGAIVVAGLAVLPFLNRGSSLLPAFKDSNLLVSWKAPPGTSLPEMNRVLARVGQELRTVPGVDDVGANVGRAVTADQVVNVNSSELWLSIDPSADYGTTVSAVQRVIDGYPGFDHTVLTYPKERAGAILAEQSDPIDVRIFGQDFGVLGAKANEVRRLLSGIDGVVSPRVHRQAEQPTLEIEVNLAAAQRYGIKPGDVRRAAAALVSGMVVGDLFQDQKVFEVVVWSTPEIRSTLTEIRDLQIDTPGGGHVRLGDVADVRIAPNPSVIRHEASSRSIDVTAGVSGRSVDAVASDVRQRLKAVAFPLEYHAELQGGYSDREATHRHAIAVAVAAAIGIFLLLQAAFGSWLLATLAFFTLPVALGGGAMAAFATDRTLTIGSFAGFFVVGAVAVRNGMLLISRFQQLEEQEPGSAGPVLVRRGARERLTPILASALTTGMALLPLLVFGSVPGQEVVHPLAIVAVGGLIACAFQNLLLVPALYVRFGPSRGAALAPERMAVVLRQRALALARSRRKPIGTPTRTDSST